MDAFEIWCCRRMQRVGWAQKKSSNDVLELCNTQRFLLRSVLTRQLSFLGHGMRKEGLEALSLTGKIEGQCARGRQR